MRGCEDFCVSTLSNVGELMRSFCNVNLLLILLLLGGSANSSAEDLDLLLGERRSDLVETELRVAHAQVRLNVLKTEATLLDELETSPRGQPQSTRLKLPPEVVSLIRSEIKDGERKYQQALDDYQKALANKVQVAEGSWRWARNESLRFLESKAEARRLHGPLEGIESEPNWWKDIGLTLIWGLCVVVIGWLIAVHDVRRSIYRARRAAMAILLLCVMNASGCGLHETTHPSRSEWISSEITRLSELTDTGKAELLELSSQIRTMEDEIRKRRMIMLQDRQDAFLPSTTSTEATWLAELVEDAYVAIRHVRVLAELAEKLAIDSSRRLKGLERDRLQLVRAIASINAHARDARWARLIVCSISTLLCVLPLLVIRLRSSGKRRAEAAQCPRCLASKNETKKSPALAEVPGTGDQEVGNTTFMECSVCRYQFRRRHRSKVRLCFPTVGNIESGKTHWLTTIYDKVRSKRVSGRAKITNSPSINGESRFDALVTSILYRHNNPSPTRRGGSEPAYLPEPLVFHVEDADVWGRKASLVNLFDFGGELMDQSIYDDRFRQRAQMMDGFVFFLDPTQVTPHTQSSSGDGESRERATVEIQSRALEKFTEELRDLRDLDEKLPIPVPVAVCISKIDLLITDNPLGGDSLQFIRKLRETEGDDCSLSMIRLRSQLCEELVQEMFAGWDVCKALRDSFGNRFMFFPLSSVNINEKELGQKKLELRKPAPFGVLEPLLWLIHMHGYSVLKP